MEALSGLVRFFVHSGALATASGMARGGLALVVARRLPHRELPLRRLLGRLAIEVGDSRQAEHQLEKARVLAESLDMAVETCRLYLERGWAKRLRGDFDAALSLAKEGIEIARRLGLHPLLDEFWHLVGAVESVSSNPNANCERALTALDQALAGARSRKTPKL